MGEKTTRHFLSMTLPGKRGKVNIMAAPVTRPLVCPVLIGRQPHLDTLAQLIGQLYDGHGQAVLIAGEAGVGKSRLVSEAIRYVRKFQERAASPTGLILQGRCFEFDRVLPYAPLLDLLHSFFTSCSPDEIASVFGPDAPELVKLLPELASLLPKTGAEAVANLNSEQEKRCLFRSLVHFFTRLSENQPLLVIIEDVHWSDDTSLEFLLYMAQHIAFSPMLLLLTYRSEEAYAQLAPFLIELDHERLVTDLTLNHLTFDEVEEMLRTIFMQPRVLSADVLATLYSLTEGNPFFIEEMLKSLVTTGYIAYVNGKWQIQSQKDEAGISLAERLYLPRSVQLAVQRRLDHLSTEARSMLSLAAVAGRRFDFALLQQLTGQSEAVLVQLVRELITAQLVVEEMEDVFAFRHALTRQAVYSDLLARERRALHTLIAETLERLYAHSIEAHLVEIAHHCYEAKQWSKVLKYARRAGEKAQELYATRAAIEQYTHAIEASVQMKQSPPLSLYRARGQCHDVLGDFTAACNDYTQAFEAAHTAHDLPGEWQSLFDLGYLWTGRDYEQAGSYLQRALELARTMNDSLMLAHTLNRVGNWYANAEQPWEGVSYHLEALDIFQALANQRGLAETFDLLGTARYNGGGGPITGMSYYEQAIAIWRALDERQGLISSLVMLALRGTNYLSSTMVWSRTSGSACIRDAEEGLTLARQIGWRSGEALALCFTGVMLGPRGEYSQALAYAHSALDIATEIEHGPWIALTQMLLGILYTEVLSFPVARQHLEQALKLAQNIGSLFLSRAITAFLASTAIVQKDFEYAEQILNPTVDLTTPPRTAAQRLCWAAYVELELAREHPTIALELVDQLIATAINEEEGNNGVIPRLWHLRAQALLALKEMEEAENVLHTALATAQFHHAQPLLWRIYITLGKLFRSRDLRTQAAEQFAKARIIIEELAANLDDETLRETFLGCAAAQMPRPPQHSPRRTAMQAFGGLTEREREVAALIAQGQSNRELAETLVVSERTIGTHVENILSKLGFTSRAQIAVWAVEKGLAKR